MDTSLRNRFGPKVQSITLTSSKEHRLNPSRSSSIGSRKCKLNSDISFYGKREKMNPQADLGTFEFLQKNGQFLEQSEYNNILVDQHIISILFYRPVDGSYPEELSEKFDLRVQEIASTLQRKYPFMRILMKNMQDQTTVPALEVQLCSHGSVSGIQKWIVGSFLATKQLPSLELIVTNIQRTLKTVDLEITIECAEQGVVVIGPNQKDRNSLLEGLQVSLRQKSEGSTQIQLKQTPNKARITRNASPAASSQQDFFRTSSLQRQSLLNTSILGASTASISIAPGSSFLGQKSCMFATTTSCMSSVSRADSVSSISSPKRRESSVGYKNKPIKVFGQKALTNQDGKAIIKNIPLEMNTFYLEVLGSRELKPIKQVINVQEMYEAQSENLLRINVEIQREDLTKGFINVKPISEAIGASVKIGNFEFWNRSNQQSTSSSNQWFQEIEYCPQKEGFVFFSEPGSYFMEVSKEGCSTERKQIHLKRGVYNTDITLRPHTLVTLKLITRNLITQDLESNFNVSVFDENNREIAAGLISDQFGQVDIEMSLLQTIRVLARKQGYVDIHQDINLSANALTHDILVIPQNENVHNRLDILIYEPNNKFQLNYSLELPGKEQALTQSNNSDTTYSASFDTISFKTGGKLTGISLENPRKQQFTLSAYSDLSKPNNPKPSWTNQMFSTSTSISKKQLQQQQENTTFMDLYSKTQIFSDPACQSKYDEHQKLGRNFCKAIQSVDGFFYGQRVSSPQLRLQQNVPDFLYLNKQLEKYSLENSARVFVIFDNVVLAVIPISQNILPQSRVLGTFMSISKTFEIAEKNGQMSNVENKKSVNRNTLPLQQSNQTENQIVQALLMGASCQKNNLNQSINKSMTNSASKEVFRESRKAKFTPAFSQNSKATRLAR